MSIQFFKSSSTTKPKHEKKFGMGKLSVKIFRQKKDKTKKKRNYIRFFNKLGNGKYSFKGLLSKFGTENKNK